MMDFIYVLCGKGGISYGWSRDQQVAVSEAAEIEKNNPGERVQVIIVDLRNGEL